MRNFLIQPPQLIRSFYRNFLWRMNPDEKVVYLTFDDGPVPGPTEFVLEQLKKYNAKATFFCIGDNVKKHKDIFYMIQGVGHSVGNHSFHHFNGWKTETESYVNDVQKAREVIDSQLFRPPYGKIKLAQSRLLLKDYKIVMWDVLSYDFDTSVTPEKCYQNVIQNVRPGSIIVFHDSEKAFPNLKEVLPRCLEFLVKNGYRMEKL
ncbi:MAG: polysaccharide deacetylase family protein [Bacteroidetes bacterium]|nr:polysaccharide deacetylase family protein [Bacteroidota bacterium]